MHLVQWRSWRAQLEVVAPALWPACQAAIKQVHPTVGAPSDCSVRSSGRCLDAQAPNDVLVGPCNAPDSAQLVQHPQTIAVSQIPRCGNQCLKHAGPSCRNTLRRQLGHHMQQARCLSCVALRVGSCVGSALYRCARREVGTNPKRSRRCSCTTGPSAGRPCHTWDRPTTCVTHVWQVHPLAMSAGEQVAHTHSQCR